MPPNDVTGRRLQKQLSEAGIDFYNLKAKQPTRKELAIRARREDFQKKLRDSDKSTLPNCR